MKETICRKCRREVKHVVFCPQVDADICWDHCKDCRYFQPRPIYSCLYQEEKNSQDGEKVIDTMLNRIETAIAEAEKKKEDAIEAWSQKETAAVIERRKHLPAYELPPEKEADALQETDGDKEEAKQKTMKRRTKAKKKEAEQSHESGSPPEMALF